jgi:hypothetical protein
MGMQTKIGLPSITSADAYNEMSCRHGWPGLCDVFCRFDCPKLAQLLPLWHAMAGQSGVPLRRDMMARLLRPYMQMLALYERVYQMTVRGAIACA